MEPVFLHEVLEVVDGELALSEHVYARKGVVNIEGRTPGDFLFANLNFLINFEVSFEQLKVKVPSVLREPVFPRNFFVVDVFVLSVIQSVGIIRVLRGESLAEVRVQYS